MLVCAMFFELDNILTFINKEDLKILDEEAKDDLKRILTCGNNEITDEEVINYILGKYPVFANYRNLKGPLTVKEYKNIKEEIGEDFWFHIMPQSSEYLEQFTLEDANNVLRRTRNRN